MKRAVFKRGGCSSEHVGILFFLPSSRAFVLIEFLFAMFSVYESRPKVLGGFLRSGLFLRGEAVPANMLAFYFSSPLQGLLCLLNSCLQCSLYMKAVRKFWAAF